MTFIRYLVTGILVALALTGLSAVSGKANAQGTEIEAAKAEGVVGEQIDGYLGIRGAVDASVRRLVNEINVKRRAAYEELAASTPGITVEQVARVTGEKQIERADVGEYYADEAGQWVQKT